MSRRHKPRNDYPEGYAEHNVEMDWRKERDAEIAADDPDRDEPSRLRVLNAFLRSHLEKATDRAELAEYALAGTISAKRAWLYIAASLIVGVFIGYILRLVFA